MLLALSLAFVGEVVPPARTGSALGLLGSMSAVGTALGPALGGLLVAGPGWRAIFLLQAPLGLLAWGLAGRHLPVAHAKSGAARPGFDVPGTLLLALALAAYALAMTLGRGSFGPLNLSLLFAAACLAALFLLVEMRTPSPLVRMAMFRQAALRASLAASGLVSTVIMATMVVGPFYLSRALGARRGPRRTPPVDRSAGGGSHRPPGRPHRGPLRRLTNDARRSRRDGGRCRGPGVAPGHAGSARLPRAHRRRHRRLCALPDGQQHHRSGERHSRPAGPALGSAQSLAQPGVDHRRLGHGRDLHARVGDERPRDRTPGGRRYRHADHLCRRGSFDRRRAGRNEPDPAAVGLRAPRSTRAACGRPRSRR